MGLNPYDPVMLTDLHYKKVCAFKQAEGQPSFWQRAKQWFGFH